MNIKKLLFPVLLLSMALSHSQQVPAPAGSGAPALEPPAGPAAADPAPSRDEEEEASRPPADGPGGSTTIGAPSLPGEDELPEPPPPPPPAGAEDDVPAEEDTPIEEADGGFLIRDAAINDIFQMLAKRAGKQYFHNVQISGTEYNVSGHLNGGDPLQQMEELAFMYGLTLYQKGSTVYALNGEQLNQLPASEWHYQLRYLRPTDIEQIKALIQPMLSPTGIANYEPKTNTIIIIDSAHQLGRARNMLTEIDQPKGQIIVEVRILTVKSLVGDRTGVDWSSLGSDDGVPLSVQASLNRLFGIANPNESNLYADSRVVLSPVEIGGVLRALASADLARQTANPTLITEDNEQATISLIDRIPIITTTFSGGDLNADATVTEEVRYRIDEQDPVGDPATTREIGVTIAVTPTLLPDGTIRMKMRPRSAQVVGVKETEQNTYPEVQESSIETIARIPNGYSLVVGGYYKQIEVKKDSKVPILGDIPIINFFFKSKDASKESASLIFVVTPTAYDPSIAAQNCRTSRRVSRRSSLKTGHDWVDPSLPGRAHDPDLERTLRDLDPRRPNYQPRPEDQPVGLDGCSDCRSKNPRGVQIRR